MLLRKQNNKRGLPALVLAEASQAAMSRCCSKGFAVESLGLSFLQVFQQLVDIGDHDGDYLVDSLLCLGVLWIKGEGFHLFIERILPCRGVVLLAGEVGVALGQ